jgi:dephospho-CoA kinase
MLADRIAADIMEPGGICYEPLKEIFSGDRVFTEDGHIDRPAMASVLFANEGKRLAVNQLVHPAVKAYVIEQYELEKQKGELDFLILEAALLIEEHYNEICDELWYIYTSGEVRRERLMVNRGYSKERVDRMFATQLSEAEYRRHCAVVIDNNGTTEETIAQVRKVLESKGEYTDGERE